MPLLQRPLLICGPSGSGKSTLLKKMLEEFPDKFGYSVSHTTRKPRLGEVQGIHYHFTDIETMEKGIQEGKFIESAVYSGNMYGTSKTAVEDIARKGKVCILDIDVQGVKQVKKSGMNPLSIFIIPPSLDELRRRLINRNTETEDSLLKRLTEAKEEMKYGTAPGNFDLILLNDDFETAYSELRQFVITNVFKNQITTNGSNL